MKRPSSCPLLVATALAFAAFFSFSTPRAEAIDILVPTDYAKIQDALDNAISGDVVLVEAGTYQETLVMRDGVILEGDELARTFLSGNGSGPIISVSGGTGGDINNFTFINASVGIQISNNATSMINIYNNAFEVGTGGTGISVQNAASTVIQNNTFYNNGTAISRDADLSITSNIFANSQITALGGSSSLSSNTVYNNFFNNVATGPTGTPVVNGDPLFVDPAMHDFHLQDHSPCIDKGDPSLGTGTDAIDNTIIDIGAYGGQFADPSPFPITGLTAAVSSTGTGTSIDLTWLPNKSYLVTNSSPNRGSYKVYYGYAAGNYNGTDANSGKSPSPISVGTATTFTLADLSTATRVPTTPVLDQPIPGNGELTLTWSAATNATGYKVHYGISSTEENVHDAGNVNSYTLTGLTNGQSYLIAVTAYAAQVYYLNATAIDDTAAKHESVPATEVSAQIGPPLESGLSNIRTDQADIAVAYPALKGSSNHCFIATAAYGSYSAPEVLALRSFRDRYLLGTTIGRLFVELYYKYSPPAAAYLNAHPAFKPAVRTALMPIVGAAIFLTEAPAPVKAAVLLFLGCAMVMVIAVLNKRRRQEAR